MLVVKLDGGLGNQMFQYAFGQQISFKYSIPLKLDISSLIEYRTYELGIFKLDADFANNDDLMFFDRRNLSLGEKVLFKIRHGFSKPLYLLENSSEDLLKLPDKISKNINIIGHWQKERYFKSIEEVIRRSFSFPVVTGEDNKKFYKLIVQTNSVGIHIRRGDYLLEQNYKVHGVLSLDYYRQAVQYIKKKTNLPVFFIFSDDSEWAKKNLVIDGDVYFVTGNHNKDTYLDMQLMSYCKHNIIANSSFSWWSAWLNTNANKIVVAPERWFLNNEKNEFSKGGIPENWIKLK